MDYRNNYNTPRDRIDDSLLSELLNQRDPISDGTADFGCNNGCGCGCGAAEMRTSTRCGTHTECALNRNSQPMCGFTSSQRRYTRRDIQSRQEDNPSQPAPCEKCMKDSRLKGYPLSMVYAPDQEWTELYDIEEALHIGTLFRELNFPFYPGCGHSCKFVL